MRLEKYPRPVEPLLCGDPTDVVSSIHPVDVEDAYNVGEVMIVELKHRKIC